MDAANIGVNPNVGLDAPENGEAMAEPRVRNRELAPQAVSQFVHIATYFNEVMPLRAALVMPLIVVPRVNAFNGMAELIPDNREELIRHWNRR